MVAETVRVATWNSQLSRAGPGLLLRDILRGEDAQVEMAIAQVAHISADILLLLNFDFDAGGKSVTAFTDRLRIAGLDYPYHFARRPNAGRQTGQDVDGDGYLGDAVTVSKKQA